ncbi:MAG: YidC/Oxa1 family insertase periplasmic-domain containing protein [Planctomycetota bacterium]
MNKRLPLALLLSLLFLWWYGATFTPKPVPVDPAAAGAPGADGTAAGQSAELAGQAGNSDNNAGRLDGSRIGAIPGSGVGSGMGSGAGAGVGAGAEGEVPLGESLPVPFEGRGYRAEFSTRGAALTWLELTDYHPAPGDDSPLRLIGHRLDPAGSLLLSDFSGRYPLDRVAWQVVSNSAVATDRARLVFQWVAPDGLVFTRTITDSGVPYAFDLDIQVSNPSGADTAGTLMLVVAGPHGLSDEQEASLLYSGPSTLAVVARTSGEVEKTEIVAWHGDDLRSGTPRRVAETEQLRGAGVASNYFATLLSPRDGTYVQLVQPEAVLNSALLASAAAKRAPEGPDRAEWERRLAPEFLTNASVRLLLASNTPTAERPTQYGFQVFAGPKDSALVEQPEIGPFLDPIVEHSHGSMAWINHGLLAVLRFFEWLTGNWGVAVILLTLVVKMLLFPINRVQQSSMAKYQVTMGKLKPELEALKAKHKNNKRKFNEEQIRLLKENKATPPLGGCLLMFLQFPIWISLFQILRSSIELRHASFAFWVDDLSAPDRMPFPVLGLESINLLPVLMAVATLIQMRMQPKTGDESQIQMQKIMGTIMPVMMLFFLYSYPSGLSLYIFTQSLLGIFEYRIIRKYWPVPGTPAAEPVKAAA